MNYLKKFNESNKESLKQKILNTLYDLHDVIADYLDKGLVGKNYRIYHDKGSTFYSNFESNIEEDINSFIKVRRKIEINSLRIDYTLNENILKPRDLSEIFKITSEVIERLKGLNYDVSVKIEGFEALNPLKRDLNIQIKVL